MRTIGLLRKHQGPGFDRTKYRRLIRSLIAKHGMDAAMKLAPGGEFEAIGILERELLIQLGLQEDDYLIDVGCGSGRLAYPLQQYLSGKYLGIDIVPAVVTFARKLVRRSDWRFEVTDGLNIPERDHQANMVCFFSVFTHIWHEQSFFYLKEAQRVLKPGGRIVFSFLDFRISNHWPLFEALITRKNNASQPPNVFIGRDAIEAWASRLNLKIVAIEDGDTTYISLSHPVVLENGTILQEKGTLGQSVCVLTLE